ncbi:MAG: ESX secretion-associated protein EspG [Umezawaea sp.]
MRTIATLSLLAFEVLWEATRAGAVPYPFEIDQHGETVDERARLKSAAHTDLERRGLARRGRPEPELEDALGLLARPDLRVTALGMPSVDDGRLVRACVVARGGYAVMAAQENQVITLNLVQGDELATALVGTLPPRHAGPGKPVTVPASTFDQQKPRQGTMQTVRGRETEDTKVVRAMLAPPMVGTGHFTATHGKRQLPAVTWFDTTQGRYVSMPAGNDPNWITLAPADNQGLAQRLTQVLALTNR